MEPLRGSLLIICQFYFVFFLRICNRYAVIIFYMKSKIRLPFLVSHYSKFPIAFFKYVFDMMTSIFASMKSECA